jgi:hypothetical protein
MACDAPKCAYYSKTANEVSTSARQQPRKKAKWHITFLHAFHAPRKS